MNKEAQKISDNITGYISIFNEPDWIELNSIVTRVHTQSPEIFESPKLGDSRNEYVALQVARFIIEREGNISLINDPYCSEILNILKRKNFITLVEQKTELKNLHILRMQLNCMTKNSFISTHRDSEHDSSYKVTAVIRTNSAFEGGELYLYGKEAKIITQENDTVFLLDSRIEHEVKKIIDGYRNSLIVVLGNRENNRD